ncbi:MAG: DUF58 domain-containing protein [Defluviitaleaceae bacterium]|nr:DUF58 domain-containing protein [Defluviitaleaceae bacterium]
MKANRIWYIIFLIGTGVYAWLSGERILYVTFIVLFALPLVSYVLTLVRIRGLRIKQNIPDAVLKNETGQITVTLHNTTPIPFGMAEVVILSDEFAVKINQNHTANLRPLCATLCKVEFKGLYRGQYDIGLASITVMDMIGLFKLRRKFSQVKKITILPNVPDVSDFPLAMNLMTQAHSRYDMRDEDYSTISDIRQYIPTDSIKRVHWKLTAKRHEWLVKVFQSNALNQVSLILDTTRQDLMPKDCLAMEDQMVEMSLSIAKFCLGKGMPVDFHTTEGFKAKTRVLPEFDVIYNAAAELTFEVQPSLDSLNILSHVLNDTTGYVNAVIFTAQLNAELYDRIINAVNNGHHIAVTYFVPKFSNTEYERVYRLIVESGIPSFRVTTGG